MRRERVHKPDVIRKLPKVSRTLPVYGSPDRGDGLDSDVWFECWYCGQLNSTRKSTLGGSDSPSGVVYVDYADNPDYGQTVGVAVLSGPSHTFTAQANGSDGNPKGVTNSIKCSDGGSGCQFCGTLNWRGDHP